MARSVSAVRTCDGLFFGTFPPFVRFHPSVCWKTIGLKGLLKGPHLLPELFCDVSI
jgi:hypothetical protein